MKTLESIILFTLAIIVTSCSSSSNEYEIVTLKKSENKRHSFAPIWKGVLQHEYYRDSLIYSHPDILKIDTSIIDTADVLLLLNSLESSKRIEFNTKCSSKIVYFKIRKVTPYLNEILLERKILFWKKSFLQVFQKGCGVIGSDDPNKTFLRIANSTCLVKKQDTIRGPVGLKISLKEKPNTPYIGILDVKNNRGESLKAETIIIPVKIWEKDTTGMYYIANMEREFSFMPDNSNYYTISYKVQGLSQFINPIMITNSGYSFTIGKGKASKNNIPWCE